MKSLHAMPTAIVTVLLLLVVSILFAATTSAHDTGEPHPHDVAQTAESNEAPAEAPAEDFSYKYTAQTDDTYSQFARKAVQTYGKINNVNLSVGQMLFIETTLTQAAGSPILVVGETREIQNSAVKAAVEQATKLSQDQVNAWAEYAVGVDFNTDSVGQN